MSTGRLRDHYREIAAELVGQGKALLASANTTAQEVVRWQKPALNALKYLGSDAYETRETRHGGFLGWVGTTFSEPARKHSIGLTLAALEEAISSERPARGADRRRNVGQPSELSSLDHAERMRAVEEAAHALGVRLPRTIEWSGAAEYNPLSDTLVLPGDAGGYTPDEYKAKAGHELRHKEQNDRSPALSAYSGARASLRVLARELLTPDESSTFHLSVTTMLAGVTAYGTFVLLGKTVGYAQELDADNGGAVAASPDAAISALQKSHAAAEGSIAEAERGMTWRERVAARVARALEDDHPSLGTRIDNLRRQNDDPSRTPSR